MKTNNRSIEDLFRETVRLFENLRENINAKDNISKRLADELANRKSQEDELYAVCSELVRRVATLERQAQIENGRVKDPRYLFDLLEGRDGE